MRLDKLLIGLLVLAVLIAVLPACGGGAETKPAVSASTKAPATSAPQPTVGIQPTQTSSAPIQTGVRVTTNTVLDTARTSPPYELDNIKYGGIFKYARNFSPGNLDPKLNSSNIGPEARWVYQTLVGWRPNPNDSFSHYEGVLAEKWDISSDYKTYTFQLRKGVKWHNIAPVNGREVIADDVVFSLNRYLEKDSVWAPSYASVESVSASGKYTVAIKLKEGSAWGLNDLFPNVQYIVPPELVKEGNGTTGTKMIGTGPYVLQDYQFRRSIKYARNPDYWQKDAKGNIMPYTDGADTIFLTDTATTVAAFRTGQLDNAPQLSTDDILNIAKTVPDVRIQAVGLPTRFGLAFNTKRAPWNDANVRRAFNMTIDKVKLIDSVVTIPGNWEWAGPMPWFMVSDKPFNTDELGPYYKYNPTEAKKLFTQAGFTDGKMKIGTPLLFGIPGYHGPRAQLLKQLLKTEGIELEIQGADRAVFQDVYYQRSWQDLGLTFQNTGDYSLNW